MPPSNVAEGVPSQGVQHDKYPPPNQPVPIASNLPAPPNLGSAIQHHEPIPPVITSDILQPSHSHFKRPRPGTSGHAAAASGLDRRAAISIGPQTESRQSASPAQTPRSSRLEVVLKLSPFKKFSGHQAFDEAALENNELAASDFNLKTHRRAPQVSSSSRHAVPVAKTTAPSVIKRPRGRPKGWRPGMPSLKTGLPTASAVKYVDANGNSARVPKPSSVSKSTGQKRRGRPPRPPSPTARNIWDTMAPPKYVPFQCEWGNCHAELQNIKTLRKHLRVVHGDSDSLVCRWAKCGKADQPPIFAQDSEFHTHVDKMHLMPYVWHCGEGQSNSRCVIKKKPTDPGQDEIPAYLLGPDGEQVTPSVRDQALEDALTYRENRQRLRRILFQRDANAPSEEEDEAGELDSAM